MDNAIKPSTKQTNIFHVFASGAFTCGYCKAFNNAGARICGCGESRKELGLAPVADTGMTVVEW